MWRYSILALVLVAAAGCGRADRSRPADRSLAQADTAAATDSAADADRPCMAARLGLPCR
ncbi:MAG TPA: hypothetical protein VJT67_02070 [Longimicrobiaceae bacterium]|nr:hypothetical protein [Longimicrobiaceae bacterium]